MSIQSQINRLKAAKTDITAAIIEKGVDVPSGAKLDTMAPLIAAIESGGGLPDGVSALATDTITLPSAAYGYDITHGLGVTPNFFFAVAEGAVTISGNSGYMIGHFASKQPIESYPAHYVNLSVTSAGINSASPGVIREADVDSHFNAETFKVYGFLKAGVTYRWVAGVIDGIG